MNIFWQSGEASFMVNRKVEIYKRKQESKKTRKKKKRTRPRARSRKQENDQEKKKKTFFFLDHFLGRVLVFLLSFINSHLSNLYNHFMTSEMDFYEQLLMNVY